MWKLVKLQFQSSYKYDLTFLIALIALIAFFKNFSIVSMLFTLLMIRANASESAQKQLKMYMAMPIDRKDIVQARFTYEAMFQFLAFIAVGIITLLKAPAELIEVLTTCTAFVIFFNMFSGQWIAAEFSAKKTSSIDFVIGILPAVGLIIIHLVLVGLTANSYWWLTILPIPIISILFITRSYKRSLEQLRLKEFA